MPLPGKENALKCCHDEMFMFLSQSSADSVDSKKSDDVIAETDNDERQEEDIKEEGEGEGEGENDSSIRQRKRATKADLEQSTQQVS